MSAAGCSSYKSLRQKAYLSGQLILLDTSEVQEIIEMEGGILSLSEYLVAEFASALHDCTKHLIVATPGEQNLSSIKLEEGTSDRPHVNSKIVRHS